MLNKTIPCDGFKTTLRPLLLGGKIGSGAGGALRYITDVGTVERTDQIMTTIRELKQKGQELKQRIAKFGAPHGNKNAAGPHDGHSSVNGGTSAHSVKMLPAAAERGLYVGPEKVRGFKRSGFTTNSRWTAWGCDVGTATSGVYKRSLHCSRESFLC